MKRQNNLYPLIATHENLRQAFRKAVRGKTRHPEVLAFRRNFDHNIEKLRGQLLNHSLDIGHYHFFVVRNPKWRTICAAAFPERVLHHAVMNICEPRLEAYAIHDSYACRKGKGNRKALARAQEFARKASWYLKLDISKYFDSIDHDIMMQNLQKRFKDPAVLLLFKKILDTYCTTAGKGVPIGNLISQHLANFYLGSMDHWIKEERGIKGFVRYMDDFLLFGTNQGQMQTELKEIKNFLEKELSLQLKQNIQLNRCFLGIPFLGFRVFPNHIRLGPQSWRRFSKKFRKYERNYAEGRWNDRQFIRQMEPLLDFTTAGDTLRWRRQTIERFGVLV